MRRTTFLFLAAALLAGAAAEDALVISLGKIAWTSDQAVSGLMARHILLAGEHPVFYWGSGYAGTFEPHLLALLFGITGASRQAFRMGVTIFLLGNLAFVGYVARRFFGRAPALFSIAVLAVPPFSWLHKGLTSDGQYNALLFLSTAVLWSAGEIDRRMCEGRPAGGHLFALGLCTGLGLWVDPMIIISVAAAGGWLLVRNPAVLRRWRWVGGALAGFLLGAAPVWIHAARHRGQDLGDVGRFALPFSAKAWLAQAALLWNRGVPIWLGGREIYRSADPFPGAGILAHSLFLVPVAAALVAIARRHPDAARLALLLATLTMALVVLPLHHGVPFLEVRFLFPMTPVFAILLGWSLSRLAARSRLAAIVSLAVVLLWNAASLGRAPAWDSVIYKPDHGTVTGLISTLRANGIHSAYASYWLAYRIDFESGEEIIAAQDPVPKFGGGWLVRYPFYYGVADRDPRPAVVLSGDDVEVFRRGMRDGGFALREVPAPPFSVFTDLDSRILAQIRQTHHIPFRKPG